MLKLVYVLMVILGGMLNGVQAPINSALSKKVGGFEGALTSFFFGTAILALVVLILGKGDLRGILTVPKWQLIGGFLGAFFVTAMIIAVPRLGVAGAIFASVIGQLVMGMVIDNFGFFGVQRIPFDGYRLLGGVLMITSLLLIFRGNFSS
ncbi:MAG: DMT family transporter [Desulfitobacteriaceae bacterium]|nr:DMT family transporter [Desulfitobacteriaceae bacterium]MDI6913723.1 DMT family transporter [Desulfitobacteriaceae bacterium]